MADIVGKSADLPHVSHIANCIHHQSTKRDVSEQTNDSNIAHIIVQYHYLCDPVYPWISYLSQKVQYTNIQCSKEFSTSAHTTYDRERGSESQKSR